MLPVIGWGLRFAELVFFSFFMVLKNLRAEIPVVFLYYHIITE